MSLATLISTLRSTLAGIALDSYQGTTALYVPDASPGAVNPRRLTGPRACRVQVVEQQPSPFWNAENPHFQARVKIDVDYPAGASEAAVQQQALTDSTVIHDAVFDGANRANPRSIDCDAGIPVSTAFQTVAAPNGNPGSGVIRASQTWVFHCTT